MKGKKAIFQKAMEYYEDGDLEQAEFLLRKLENEEKDETLKPAVFYYLGKCSGDSRQAIEYFKKASETAEKGEWTDKSLFATGLYHYSLGEYSTSKQVFENLILLTTNKNLKRDSIFFKALCSIAIGLTSESKPDLQKIIKEYPESDYCEEAYLKLADNFFLQAQGDSARYYFQRFGELFPKSVNRGYAMLRLGELYNSRGNFSGALESLKRVQSLSPGSQEAAEARSLIFELNRGRKSGQEYEKENEDLEMTENENFVNNYYDLSNYQIQVGAFTGMDNAIKLKESLESKGYNVNLINENIEGKLFYQVRIGNNLNLKQAIELQEKIINKEGLEGRIVQRNN